MITPSKTTMALAATIVSAALLNGQVILKIDFEANVVPSGNWNVVDSNTGADAGNLIDWNTGSTTGISLSISGMSTSSSTGQDTSRSVYPAWSTSAANEDRFFMGSNSTGNMTISGLTAGMTYTIDLVSAYSSGNSGKEYGTFRMDDASALGYAIPFNGNDGTTRLDYPSNAYHTDVDGTAWWTSNLDASGSSSSEWMTEGWLQWNGVADSNGQLTLDFTTTSNSNSRVALNSMQIGIATGSAQPRRRDLPIT
jgi:hypothetical protein